MIEKLKGRVFKVGGAVRDKLLNREVTETDYVVINSSPEELKKLGLIKVGKSFPVFLHPKTKEEFALARTENKISKGYHGFNFNIENISLEMDLKRRDLTINSIAEDFEGNIIDPFNGRQDLKNKILRHTSSAFKEDPVRVLRLARFYAVLEDFIIAPETFEIVRELKNSNELNYLTKERILKELEKMVKKARKPYLFFYILEKLDVLENIFPYFKKFEKLKDLEYLKLWEMLAILGLENNFTEFKKMKLSKQNLTYILTFINSFKFFQIIPKKENIDDLIKFCSFFRNDEVLETILRFHEKLLKTELNIQHYKNILKEYKSAGKFLIHSERQSKEKLYQIRVKKLTVFLDYLEKNETI